MAADSDNWILNFRNCITQANPHITVGQLMELCDDGPQMATVFQYYNDGKSPKEAYDAVVEKFGKDLGV